MKSLFVLALSALLGGNPCHSAERTDSTHVSQADGEREERRIETVVVSTDMPKSYIDKKHIPVAVSQLRSEELEPGRAHRPAGDRRERRRRALSEQEQL